MPFREKRGITAQQGGDVGCVAGRPDSCLPDLPSPQGEGAEGITAQRGRVAALQPDRTSAIHRAGGGGGDRLPAADTLPRARTPPATYNRDVLAATTALVETDAHPRRAKATLLALAIAIGLTAGFAALMLWTKTDGDAQVNFASHEPELGLPGGRIMSYPGRAEAVLKVWGLDNLKPPDVYQIWALDPVTGPRLLGATNSSIVQEIDLFLRTDLTRVPEILVTVPPVEGSSSTRGDTIVSLTRVVFK
jgi:hypothetical protein